MTTVEPHTHTLHVQQTRSSRASLFVAHVQNLTSSKPPLVVLPSATRRLTPRRDGLSHPVPRSRMRGAFAGGVQGRRSRHLRGQNHQDQGVITRVKTNVYRELYVP